MTSAVGMAEMARTARRHSEKWCGNGWRASCTIARHASRHAVICHTVVKPRGVAASAAGLGRLRRLLPAQRVRQATRARPACQRPRCPRGEGDARVSGSAFGVAPARPGRDARPPALARIRTSVHEPRAHRDAVEALRRAPPWRGVATRLLRASDARDRARPREARVPAPEPGASRPGEDARGLAVFLVLATTTTSWVGTAVPAVHDRSRPGRR